MACYKWANEWVWVGLTLILCYCTSSDETVSDTLELFKNHLTDDINCTQQGRFHNLSHMNERPWQSSGVFVPVIREESQSFVYVWSCILPTHKSRHLVLTSSIILTYFGTEQLPLCSNVPLSNLWGPSARTPLHLAVKKHQPTGTCAASTPQMERLITRRMNAGDLWETVTVWS